MSVTLEGMGAEQIFGLIGTVDGSGSLFVWRAGFPVWWGQISDGYLAAAGWERGMGWKFGEAALRHDVPHEVIEVGLRIQNDMQVKDGTKPRLGDILQSGGYIDETIRHWIAVEQALRSFLKCISADEKEEINILFTPDSIDSREWTVVLDRPIMLRDFMSDALRVFENGGEAVSGEPAAIEAVDIVGRLRTATDILAELVEIAKEYVKRGVLLRIDGKVSGEVAFGGRVASPAGIFGMRNGFGDSQRIPLVENTVLTRVVEQGAVFVGPVRGDIGFPWWLKSSIGMAVGGGDCALVPIVPRGSACSAVLYVDNHGERLGARAVIMLELVALVAGLAMSVEGRVEPETA